MFCIGVVGWKYLLFVWSWRICNFSWSWWLRIVGVLVGEVNYGLNGLCYPKICFKSWLRLPKWCNRWKICVVVTKNWNRIVVCKSTNVVSSVALENTRSQSLPIERAVLLSEGGRWLNWLDGLLIWQRLCTCRNFSENDEFHQWKVLSIGFSQNLSNWQLQVILSTQLLFFHRCHQIFRCFQLRGDWYLVVVGYAIDL